MWTETLKALDELHAFLAGRAGRGGKLAMDQVKLAGEFGISHDKMHRLTKKLLDDGRLKEIGRGARGMKTVIVQDLPIEE